MEDNNRMEPKEVHVKTTNFVDSAQDWNYLKAFVNVELNIWVV